MPKTEWDKNGTHSTFSRKKWNEVPVLAAKNSTLLPKMELLFILANRQKRTPHYGSRQVHFLGLRQRRTSTSDSIGPPTASDFNLRQHRTSTSDSIGPPTTSDFNLRQHRTSDSVGLHLRQRRSSISDSVGLLSPTAADFYLRQRRTSSPTASERTTISDSVGLQSPTAS